jgi:hypothetical protein
MVRSQSKKAAPPYVSYKTFRNFIERLETEMPARIDRSYWGDIFSGSVGTQLVSALRFLDLIGDSDQPTERLRQLARTRGENRRLLLKSIAQESFSFVMQSGIDLKNATYAQLQESFQGNFQLTDDVCRKCLKFFISMANDSGIELSPFIIKKVRPAYTSKSNTRKMAAEKIEPVPSSDGAGAGEWEKMLLEKFPTFDPSWSDEVKISWFNAFDELLKRGNHTS